MTAVAIDGPAGAGKSTVARAVAAALGYRYLDTGAMYRAIAVAALDSDLDIDDEAALGELVRRTRLELDGEVVRVDGRDVGSRLRSKEVTEAAARVAKHATVREELVELQRRLALEEDVVMEGRDIGTEVLPGAEAKIFLTASLSERAKRRAKEHGLADDAETLTEIQHDIERRDRSDMERELSPLMQAADASVVDTTGMSLDEVVQRIAEIVRLSTGHNT